MSYQVLYRTYRPSKFEEVVGQEYIVKTLKNSIKLNKIAHAYLFAGPRGTGKTTIAKLFAKAINCEEFNEEACECCKNCEAYNSGKHPDIIELDAASNNGVDDIREIVEQVSYAPIVGKYKVYIIDEVHMLTTSASNALLKTLEEPPAHVIFILATTDPQKIIPTILSRCQRYNFSKISNFDMKKKMIEILKNENLEYEEKAIEEVAILAEGGMRDALSILEQILSYNSKGIFLKDVQNIFGLSSTEEKINLLINIHQDNITTSIKKIRDMYQSGIDIKRLIIDLLDVIKDGLIFSCNGEDKLLEKLNRIQAMKLLEIINPNTLLSDVKLLEDLINNYKGNQNILSYFELCVIQMSANKIANSKPIIKEVKETVKEEIVEDTNSEVNIEVIEDDEQQVIEYIPEEEEIVEEENNDEESLEYLASLLLKANKNEKINDQIIYNKLELYKLEADKRKFYELLNKTSLFASGNDAIIIVGDGPQISNINSKETRTELYSFILNEFGIDKVIFAIYENQKEEIKKLYYKLKGEDNIEPGKVIKPQIEKERSNEEKLKELFDNVRIED